MSPKNHQISSYSMSPSDVEAILIALPLVDFFPGTAPAQRMINSALCKSSAEKLRNHQSNFAVNELRVIAAATLCAVEYLSGRLPEIRLEAATDNALRGHLFSYTRLNAYFQSRLEAFDNQDR